jgi:flagellar protein FlaI
MEESGGKPQITGQKKRLLDLINSAGRLNISDASDKLELDKTLVSKLVDELGQAGLIRIEAHYLREPDVEALNYRKQKKELGEEAKELSMHTPEAQKAKEDEGEAKEKLLDNYILTSDDVHFDVKIIDIDDYVPHYMVSMPRIDFVTRALLDETKRSLIGEVKIETRDVFDSMKFQKLKVKFTTRAKDKLRNVLKKSSEEYVATLSKLLVNEMLGLGELEYMLLDNKIEEVVVNNSKDPVWIYHKEQGWLKTNVILPTEELIMNYASRVAREVGREITHLTPLLDAHLVTGDRVNATLFPISTSGNTLTIRRFSREPWSAIHLMNPAVDTLNSEVAAFLWLAVEYELSILVAGGTASGKTTMLNAIMPFMPANQRILSIEDTRELNLPDYLHWIPLSTRPPNPEGEGGITMLDLLQNSLRMRPDRIIVGEVRAKRETEVMFEAMHTGHSVYATFHAERAQEVVDRITSPPMDIPGMVMRSLHLIVIQYRNRRTGKRRTFEICEITKDESDTPSLNTLYKWDPKSDTVNKMYPSLRVKDELALFTGITEREIEEDLKNRRLVLDWLLASGIKDVNSVGKVVTDYYLHKDRVIDSAKKGSRVDLTG